MNCSIQKSNMIDDFSITLITNSLSIPSFFKIVYSFIVDEVIQLFEFQT